MYIEQGYRGNLGLWKYFVIPTLFLGLMVLNYILLLLLPVDLDEVMAQNIAQYGTHNVFISVVGPLAFGLFFVLGWTRFVHPQSIRSLTTSRPRVDWGRIGFAFLIWGGLTAALTFLDIALSPEDYQWNFVWQEFLKLAVLALLLIPMQTSFEEYLFRGHMMQGLGILARNRWVPLVITSTLFGIMHLGNPEVEKLGYGILIFYIGTGFFLGIITLMDEGLELALGFHAANNLITALLVTADWTAFQTDSLYKDIAEPEGLSWELLVPVFIIYPLLLWLFARKYGWTDWKGKLFGRVMSKEEATAVFEGR